MNQLDDVRTRKPRWILAAVALLILGLLGAVVWERANGTVGGRKVAVAAVVEPDDGTISAVAIEIDGVTSFASKVEGLTMTAKGPGTDLKFIRGLTDSTTFTDWLKLAAKGKTAARKNVVIRLLDNTLTEVARYNVAGAVPLTVNVAPVGGNTVPIETLTVSYEGIQPA